MNLTDLIYLMILRTPFYPTIMADLAGSATAWRSYQGGRNVALELLWVVLGFALLVFVFWLLNKWDKRR